MCCVLLAMLSDAFFVMCSVMCLYDVLCCVLVKFGSVCVLFCVSIVCFIKNEVYVRFFIHVGK